MWPLWEGADSNDFGPSGDEWLVGFVFVGEFPTFFFEWRDKHQISRIMSVS